jgi:hypothetical protein
MNDRKIERVARAICDAARKPMQPELCPHCGGTDGKACTMWPQFVGEAQAALRAAKGF